MHIHSVKYERHNLLHRNAYIGMVHPTVHHHGPPYHLKELLVESFDLTFVFCLLNDGVEESYFSLREISNFDNRYHQK
jgi:hypothetical protein